MIKKQPVHTTPLVSGVRRYMGSGFTLIEILVVLSILAMLVGLTMANLGKVFGDSKITVTSIMVKQSLKTSLFTYRVQMGDYPTTDEGLQALFSAPPNRADRWRGPYVDDSIKWPLLDPWNEPYQYRFPGVHNKNGYDLWSKGPDKIDGTEDDIGNW